MSTQQTLADILDGLAARILAADATNKDEIVQIGAALENATTGAAGLTDAAGKKVTSALEILASIYQGKAPDASAAMDSVATAVADAVQSIREPGTPSTAGDQQTKTADAPVQPVAAPADHAPVATTPVAAEPAKTSPASAPAPSPAPALVAAAPTAQAAAANQTPAVTAEPPRLPADADMDLLKEFIVECLDHITAAEAALLDLESNPDAAEPVNVIFRAFHTIKGTSGFLGLDRLQKLAHLAENLLDRARDGEIHVVGGYADLALNSCDSLRTMIEGLKGVEAGGLLTIPATYDDLIVRLSNPEAAGVSEQIDAEPMRVGDILVGKQKADREEVEQVAKEQGGQPIGQALVEKGAASATDVADALRTQNKQAGKPSSGDNTVRVSTDRLDGLIDAVGELVIAQSMVAQDPVVTDGMRPQLSRNVSHAGKIVRELQDVSMSLRMVPLKATFGKMARLVRDLGKKAGKKVQFVTEGDDTEIDRNMVEVLNDPLVHMMRNAVDHGVEMPEQRIAAGKDPMGTVGLRAYHSAGNVVIELTDDGKGLNRDKIRAKAIERGLIKPDAELSESEAFALIFRPGFSTADKITDVSGRGVGMDVVKTGIESLRGRVDVFSQPGAGSTFMIRLPLTMAITDAMLVRVGAQRYLLPVVAIEHSFRPEAEQLSSITGRGEVVNIRGELLPIFRLHKLFSVSDAATDAQNALLIIVQGEGMRCALMVDELLGQQQVVVKSLGRSLGQVPGVSGGAILGDGRVGLILDAGGLVKLASGVTNSSGLTVAA